MSKKLDFYWHMVLYGGLAIGAIAAYVSRFDSTGQFVILGFLVSFYLVWGWAYHHTKGDMSKKIYIEYIAVALIALGAGYLVLMN